MPRLESPGVAAVEMPARANVAAVTQIGSIQAQTGDRRENVTVSRINREPTSAASFAVTKKIARRYWLIKHSGVMEREGNCSGAIVTVIAKRAVSPAPNVRAPANCVHRPDRMFHTVGRVRRRVSDSVTQDGAIAANHRMRIGEIKSRCSNLRIGFVTINRLGGTDRTRWRVICDLNRLRALRLAFERKRLERHPIDSLRCKDGSSCTRKLRLGIRPKYDQSRERSRKVKCARA